MDHPTFLGTLFGDARTRTRLILVYVGLIGFNVIAWAWAFAEFRTQPILIGTAFLAYVFGLRHAFDADHIAAIDNVVRKLMQEGKKPLSVGLFFSLGHSSIVVIASAVIAASAAALQGQLDGLPRNRRRDRHAGVGVLPAWRSGSRICWCCAASGGRSGEPSAARRSSTRISTRCWPAAASSPASSAGCSAWCANPGTCIRWASCSGSASTPRPRSACSASRPTQAASGMSFWSIMVFPALFTAGMALVDTTDSVAMVGAYGWAFVNPIRKLWYNLTITAASVAVAIFIGGVEALGLLSRQAVAHRRRLGRDRQSQRQSHQFRLRRGGGVPRELADLDAGLSRQPLRRSGPAISGSRKVH